MIREQKWVIVPIDMSDVDCEWLALSNSACGYIRGVPPSLYIQATTELWTLPHVWTETWDDGDGL